jgi:hypothetical protein
MEAVGVSFLVLYLYRTSLAVAVAVLAVVLH